MLTLEKHDLKELGVTRFGERAILLGEIAELRTQKVFNWVGGPIKVEDVDVEIKTGNFHYLKQIEYAARNFKSGRTVPLYIREEAVKMWRVLCGDQSRLFVFGPPGTGKSSIAWLWACSNSKTRHILWVSLAMRAWCTFKTAVLHLTQ